MMIQLLRYLIGRSAAIFRRGEWRYPLHAWRKSRQPISRMLTPHMPYRRWRRQRV